MEIKKENLDNIVTYIKEHIITPGAGVYIEMIEKAVHEIAANDGIEYLLALRDAVSERLTGPERGDGAYLHFVDLVDDKWANPPETPQTAAIEGASGPQPGQATDTKPEPKVGQDGCNETATRQQYEFNWDKARRYYDFLADTSTRKAIIVDCSETMFLAAIETADFRNIHINDRTKLKYLYALNLISKIVTNADGVVWKNNLKGVTKKDWDYLRSNSNNIEGNWVYKIKRI